MSDACCGGDVCRDEAVHPEPPAPSRWATSGSVIAGGVAIALGAGLGVFDARWAVPLYLVAILLSAERPVRGALRSVQRGVLDINVLMVVAVIGAGLLGEWFEAATVVWLFGVAQALETRSLARARRAIRSLMTLAPAIAIVRRAGGELEVAARDVAVGEAVVVRPGARLPVDGVVALGTTAIDQRAVTGESLPVEKGVGDVVYAGTVNGNGAIEITAHGGAEDSTIGRIVRMVESAQRQRAPVEAWVERFAMRYTPAVVGLAVLVAVVPPLTGGWGVDVATWFYRALALLVVACPCALVISTPVSFVSALTSAARAGVLIKGGAHLERLGLVKCVAFDKTGTLTAGRISVTDVRAVDGESPGRVLAVAAALEARSDHPIARAIVEHARSAQVVVTPGDDCRALPGLGAEGSVGLAPAVIGSHRLFEARQMCTPALHADVVEVEQLGRTPVLVGRAGVALGVLGLEDTVRDGGRQAVDRLRDEGVERVVLLTGDHPATADRIRAVAGLDEAHASLLPADKVDHLVRLRGRYGPVAMVGDGINDAPALAAADVGIAMGAAGTAAAIETADVALLTDDLEKLPFALRLGRATLSTVRTNVGLALGLKAAFVLLAISGGATLWMAVLADTGASLLVTANSLRLLRVR